MCGWCLAYCTGVVLNTVYGKAPRLILKKTSRRTQAVVVSEGIFCAARCCVIFYLQSMKVYPHMPNGNVQQNLLCLAFCHQESSHLAPVLAYDFLLRWKFSPRNPLTRWDVSWIPANGIFLTKKLKDKIKMSNGWRTIKSLVHKIPKFDFTLDEGKEWLNPSREKN